MTFTRSLGAGALLLIAACAGCTKPAGDAPGQGGQKRGAIEFPVEVEAVKKVPLRYQLSAVGSIDAFERVQVTARVAGVVERVRFREGDVVKKDDVLVEIEPERYRLAVEAARAMMERAKAAATEASAALERREAASTKNPGLIRGEELETFKMRALTANAELLAAKTSLEQAELNLHDALVRAPIAGRLQTRTVQTGQYAQPGALLASMVRRDPMLLRFKVPEHEVDPLAPGMIVELTTRGDATPRRAKITLVAELADEATRMVPVIAEVLPEDAKDLKPGAFAEVAITHGSTREAPVIPQTAIRPSERGFLAFVVKDGVAEERVVQLGTRSEGGVEVRSGLEGGELLVVRGSEALRTGAKVKVAGAKATDAKPAGDARPAAEGSAKGSAP